MTVLVRFLIKALAPPAILLALIIAVLTATAPGLVGLSRIINGVQSAIVVEGISGVWRGPLGVRRLAIADADGVWLTLEDISIAPDRLALLGGTVKAELVSVARIAAARRPVAGEGGGGGGLPVSLDIAAIDLPEIALEAPVAGTPARFSAQGTLKLLAEPLDIAATFDLDRIDGEKGGLSLDLAFNPDANQLALNATAFEPQGGVVARLLDLPGHPALRLTLEGSGGLDNFTSDLALLLDERTTVSGAIKVAGDDAGRRLDAALSGALAPFIPPRFKPLLAGQSEIKADITFAGDGRITARALSLRSATTTLTASGDYRNDGLAADVKASLGAPGSRLRIESEAGEAVDIGMVTLTGRASGTPANLDWTLALEADDIGRGAERAKGVSLSLKGEAASLNPRDISFQVKGVAQSLTAKNDTVTALLTGPVKIDGAGTVNETTLKLTDLTLASDVANVAVKGAFEFGEPAFESAITAMVKPDIPHPVQRWLGSAPAVLSADLAWRQNGPASISNINLDGAVATASGALNLDDGILSGALDVDLPDLGLVDPNATGAASLGVKIEGPVSAPVIAATVAGEGITVMGEAVSDVAAQLDFTANPAAPQGLLKVTAGYRGQPLSVDITARPGSQGRTELAPVAIAFAGASLDGTLTWMDTGPDGSFRVSVPDMSALGPLLLRDDLGGAVEGTLAVRSDPDGSTLNLDLAAPTLAAAALDARAVQITATVVDLLTAPRPTGTVTAGQVLASGTNVNDLTITATPGENGIALTVAGTADGVPLDVEGRIAPGTPLVIGLTRAQTRFRGQDVRLAEPADITVKDGMVMLDDARIALGGGIVAVTGAAGSALNLDVALSGINASVANAFAPELGLAGPVSGSVTVTGEAANPEIAYDLDWASVSTKASREAGLGGLALSAKGTYAGKAVTLASRITGASGLSFNVDGQVDLQGAPAPDLKVKGSLPFELAAAQLARSGLRLTGAANADLTIAGSATAPVVTGTVTTRDATFVDTRSNLVLKNMSGTARLTGRSVEISGLDAEIASGGTIRASGSVGLGNGLPADIAIEVRNGRYSDGQLVTAEFGADIAVTGPVARAPVLGGTVTIASANITLPDSYSGGVDVVDVQHRNAPAPVSAQVDTLQAGKGGSGSALDLDLTLAAPRRIFVRGRGIDAEFGGTIKMVGSATAPRAIGAFSLIRGRMDVLARRLTFSRGRIGFSGSLVPDIDFSADALTSGGTVTLGLSGPADDLDIAVSATPAKPDDEALALLVFGRSIDNLSPIQIAQLADALAALNGGGSGSVLEKLRNAAGIDTLDVTTDESGQGAAVSAGRYINERTFIGVSQGTEGGSTRVTIDLDITDTIKARGETGANGATKGGIFFERNY